MKVPMKQKQKRKGIILAGGSGTRLHPVTYAVSKQLLPVYDKPMIYYSICVLMLAGIREIAIITTPHDQAQFKRLLGDGAQWGLEFTWIVQPKPEGLAQAYILAEDFLDGAPSAMILGDNIFYGHGLRHLLQEADANTDSSTIFAYYVSDPERYGVASFDDEGRVTQIVEKPSNPESNYAITGLYFLDGDAPARAKTIKPSKRGEIEITDLLESYLNEDKLHTKKMGRGYTWLDTGTHTSLLEAGLFVRMIQTRQGQLVGCPNDIRSFLQQEKEQAELATAKAHEPEMTAKTLVAS